MSGGGEGDRVGGERKRSDRGQPAGHDPETGEVHGSGAGIGRTADSDEDYDDDLRFETPSEKPDDAENDRSPAGGA